MRTLRREPRREKRLDGVEPGKGLRRGVVLGQGPFLSRFRRASRTLPYPDQERRPEDQGRIPHTACERLPLGHKEDGQRALPRGRDQVAEQLPALVQFLQLRRGTLDELTDRLAVDFTRQRRRDIWSRPALPLLRAA